MERLQKLIAVFGHWFVALVFVLALFVGLGAPILLVLLVMIAVGTWLWWVAPQYFCSLWESHARGAFNLEEDFQARVFTRKLRLSLPSHISFRVEFWRQRHAPDRQLWPSYRWVPTGRWCWLKSQRSDWLLIVAPEGIGKLEPEVVARDRVESLTSNSTILLRFTKLPTKPWHRYFKHLDLW